MHNILELGGKDILHFIPILGKDVPMIIFVALSGYFTGPFEL